MAAGGNHSLALKSDGTVWAWGQNTSGQLGDGTTSPRNTAFRVNGLTDVVAIGGGFVHSVALKRDGTVWAWGNNQYGQLGDGTTTRRTSPVRVGDLTGVSAISAGLYSNLALKTDGLDTETVWGWGYNGNGQLGDGSTADRSSPVQGPSGFTAVVMGAITASG